MEMQSENDGRALKESTGSGQRDELMQICVRTNPVLFPMSAHMSHVRLLSVQLVGPLLRGVVGGAPDVLNAQKTRVPWRQKSAATLRTNKVPALV